MAYMLSSWPCIAVAYHLTVDLRIKYSHQQYNAGVKILYSHEVIKAKLKGLISSERSELKLGSKG
jgi:hypothetical protein